MDNCFIFKKIQMRTVRLDEIFIMYWMKNYCVCRKQWNVNLHPLHWQMWKKT